MNIQQIIANTLNSVKARMGGIHPKLMFQDYTNHVNNQDAGKWLDSKTNLLDTIMKQKAINLAGTGVKGSNGIEEVDNKKLVDYTHQKVIPTLDKIFSHNTGNTLLGGTLGAGAGFLSSNKKKQRIRNALIGSALGAGSGYGFSRALPDYSQKLNNFMVSNLVRKPVGRVATNVFAPFEYTKGKGEDMKDRKLSDILKAIWKDEPLYDNSIDLKNGTGGGAREYLWRKSFDLPARPIKVIGYDGKEMQNVPSLYKPIAGDDHNVEYNKENPLFTPPSSAADLYNTKSMYVPMLRQAMYGEQNLYNPVMKQTTRQPVVSKGQGVFNTMGTYTMQPDKYTGGKWNVVDPWDFDLHKDEHIFDATKVMREGLNRIINPVTVNTSFDLHNDGPFKYDQYRDPKFSF